MSEIILVTGGCRSGKSNYAEKLALEIEGKRLYIATAPVLDDEMKERIAKHKENRANKGWDTIEEEINITDIFKNNPNYDVYLVDCLTLWINNLIFNCETKKIKINEEFIINKIALMFEALKNIAGRVIFVINEVGMGIVPENKLSRLFRDLSGRCSQIIANNANNVVLMSCGIPINLK